MKGLFYENANANAIGHITAEIWKDQVYAPFLHGRKDLTIIDAGANVGFFTLYASDFAKRIYSIEPAEEHQKVLKHMIEFNKLEDIAFPRKFALSIKDDKGKLTHYTNTTMHSLYENIQGTGGLAITGQEDTILKRLDTFFKEEKLDHVDFLKLDVEGVEFEILGSESFSNVSDKIDQMVIELHAYSGRNPNQLVDALKLNGFEVSQIPNDATLLAATRK